jgi:hypothetical protein
MLDVTPIVFVVDGDISARESLELLVQCESWQRERVASAQEFLDRPRAPVPIIARREFRIVFEQITESYPQLPLRGGRPATVPLGG